MHARSVKVVPIALDTPVIPTYLYWMFCRPSAGDLSVVDKFVFALKTMLTVGAFVNVVMIAVHLLFAPNVKVIRMLNVLTFTPMDIAVAERFRKVALFTLIHFENTKVPSDLTDIAVGVILSTCNRFQCEFFYFVSHV